VEEERRRKEIRDRRRRRKGGTGGEGRRGGGGDGMVVPVSLCVCVCVCIYESNGSVVRSKPQARGVMTNVHTTSFFYRRLPEGSKGRSKGRLWRPEVHPKEVGKEEHLGRGHVPWKVADKRSVNVGCLHLL